MRALTTVAALAAFFAIDPTDYWAIQYPFEFSDTIVLYVFLGALFCSYSAALILSLAAESPMIGLEKVLLGRK